MVISRLFSFFLRLAELVCSVIVLGINGWFIHQDRKYHTGVPARFIYVEVAAALGTLFALIWLIPTMDNVAFHWVGDFILSVLFWAAFGLVVDWFGASSCGGVFNWSGLGNDDSCHRWKAVEAFSFLAALFFLVSALLALYLTHRGGSATTHTTTTRRRGWYRSHRV